MSKPNPQKAKQRLLQAILSNEPANKLLFETLCNASVTVGPVTIQIWSTLDHNLKEYADAWLTLTSTKGRKYIRDHMDGLLDYIEYLVKYREVQ